VLFGLCPQVSIEIMDAWIPLIVQTLASSAVAILAFIGLKSTALGERFLNHHLERKIADLKHAQGEKIEALRADLGHIQDRGRRANELEFDAATKIWHAFVDAYLKTQQAIVDYSSFPDLNKLSDDDLTTFLESTDLSAPQRAQVSASSDKVTMYSKIVRQRRIGIAGGAIYDGRLLLRTNGIFISSTMSKSFKGGFEILSKAHVEQLVNFEHGRGPSNESSVLLISPAGEQVVANLETLVRSTLRRE
jgi:hypothetical protein